jgi:hypothetical protein
VEYVLYILILAVAVSLTLPTPPRALSDQAGMAAAGQQGGGFKTTVKNDDGYSIDVDVTPARTGENMFMITVRGKDGAVIKPEGVEMTLNLPSAGVMGVEKKGEAAGPEMWHFMVGETIIPGEWEVTAFAFVTAFDKVEFSFKVPIK